MLKSNVFIHVNHQCRKAALFDSYSCKIYSIPYEVGCKANNGALSSREEHKINSIVTDSCSQKYKDTDKSLESLRLLVTNRCNFKCKYCFADGGSYGLPNTDMSDNTVVKALSYFFGRYDLINQISFFGGEPLLALDVIETACAWVDAQKLRQTPCYSLVTNASLLSDRAIRVLSKHNIAVIASIDGPKEVNDLQRISRSGDGTFVTVDKNIRRCVGKLNLSVEATYTRNHVKMNISHTMLRQYLSDRYCTSRVQVVNTIDYPDDSSHLGDFDKSPVQECRDFFDGGCSVFSDRICGLIKVFLTGRGQSSFCPAGVARYAVDMKGDIYPCHLYVGNKNAKLANIWSKDPLPPTTLPNKNKGVCRKCAYRLFCTVCVHSMGVGRSYCQQERMEVDYFLHHLIDLLLSDREAFDTLIRNFRLYLSAHGLRKSDVMRRRAANHGRLSVIGG